MAHVHSPKRIQVGWGGHQDREGGSQGQRDKVTAEVRGQSSQPPGSWLCSPMTIILWVGRSREGGDLPALPGPHPALPPWLWVPAIFGQKILPKLGDA